MATSGSSALAEPAQAPAASGQRYVWQKQTVATLPYDAEGDAAFFTRTRLCAESYRHLRLLCWDVKTGKETLRYERELPRGAKAASRLHQLQEDSVTLAYQVGAKVLVRQVDLASGAEQRAFEFPLSDFASPVAWTFAVRGGRLVVVYRMPDPQDAKLPKGGKPRPRWLGRARVVSAETGALERAFALDIDPSTWQLSGSALYVERSSMAGDAVSGFDISTGKKRFNRPFPNAFIHGIGAGPDGVYVQLDDKVVKLDERTGRVLGTASIGREGT